MNPHQDDPRTLPEPDRSRIAADVHRLFSELAASGLIQAEAALPLNE